MNLVYKDFQESLDQALAQRKGGNHRVGAEFKFPFVWEDGSAVDYETVTALWDYLASKGWATDKDSVTGKVIGAHKPGEYNDTVASCETGFCKVEFSFAHVDNIFDLEKMMEELREELRAFALEKKIRFLGLGIHPVTPPSNRLLMKKARSGVWDKIRPSNTIIPPEDGDDLHLFTVNSATHCHIGVDREEVIPMVNVLNGFAGAQLALTANSTVWRGQVDKGYRCVADKFWDWWMPDGNRVGVPEKRFTSLEDYCRVIGGMKPVFVKRDGKPFVLEDYDTFEEYYNAESVQGIDSDGKKVTFKPDRADLDLHNTCYWYNARISRYYTVENRTNDQQPADALYAIPALTLGLASNLVEASKALDAWPWDLLRASRQAALTDGPRGEVQGVRLTDLAGRMLELAEAGLKGRSRGEEVFLEPLQRRLETKRCPADEAEEIFKEGGIDALVKARQVLLA